MKTELMQLTPELNARMKAMASTIINQLSENFTPMEAYALLHMLMDSLKDTYGIQGMEIMEMQSEKVN